MNGGCPTSLSYASVRHIGVSPPGNQSLDALVPSTCTPGDARCRSPFTDVAGRSSDAEAHHTAAAQRLSELRAATSVRKFDTSTAQRRACDESTRSKA